MSKNRDASNGAIIGAGAAPDTFIKVDFSQIVFDMDCIVFADLYAFHAAYAADFARLAHNTAFVMA